MPTSFNTVTREAKMFKVIAVYRVPADESAKVTFEDHYKNIHTAICLKIPGIKELRTNKIFGGPTGASNLHMVTEMCFENKDAWKAAMKTPEMMESGKDAMKFAGDLVSVHFAEEIITKA
jgi:uncharacterized protein (TIGR02118 family)